MDRRPIIIGTTSAVVIALLLFYLPFLYPYVILATIVLEFLFFWQLYRIKILTWLAIKNPVKTVETEVSLSDESVAKLISDHTLIAKLNKAKAEIEKRDAIIESIKSKLKVRKDLNYMILAKGKEYLKSILSNKGFEVFFATDKPVKLYGVDGILGDLYIIAFEEGDPSRAYLVLVDPSHRYKVVGPFSFTEVFPNWAEFRKQISHGALFAPFNKKFEYAPLHKYLRAVETSS